MKRRIILLISLGLLSLARAEEKSVRTLQEVLKSGNYREKLLIQGKVTRSFDFDRFLVSDSTGEMAIFFEGVPHVVHKGDNVVVYGRFMGKMTYINRYQYMEALDWAQASDPAAKKLIEKYGAVPQPPADAPALVAPPRKDVESRLKELEDLKSKKLISPEEYKEERKRILDSL